MKLTINNEEYVVTWKHNNNTGLVNNDNKPVKSSTQCIITISGGGVVTGTCVTHPKDGYNRKIGKKMSFARAVSNFNDRAIRTQLWEAYWNSMRKMPVLIEVTEDQASLLNTIADIETKDGIRYYTVNRNIFILKLKSDDNSQSDS